MLAIDANKRNIRDLKAALNNVSCNQRVDYKQ